MPEFVLSRRGLLAGAGGIGLAALLAACGVDDEDAPAADGPAKQGGTLRAGTLTPPTAVEPVTMYDGSSIALVQLVADYLIWLDSDFKLVPRLAEKWTGEDGNKRWVFTLRKGVVFSDGTPLDAAAVKASFDRLLDPKSKSAALSAFDTVLAPGGVAVQDPQTVVFTLERAFSDFPYLVSAGNYNAVILKADYAGDFTKNAIGTGPFVLKDFNPSTGASLTRNDKYWEEGKPYLDGVEVRFYKDSQAEQLALQSGELDTLFITEASVIQAVGDIALDEAAGTAMTALTLRVDQAPFDKKEVRQAVAYALDRPAVNQAVNDNIGKLGNDHLYAPLFASAPTDIPQRAKDPAKVKELLAAAGVPKLEFTLTFDPPNKDYALVIQAQLKEVGITVNLDQRTSAAFYGGNQETDTPWLFTTANLVGWAGRAVPSQFVSPMVTSKGVWNGSKYANPALDAALTAYDAAADDAERKKQAKIIATALHEDVPVVLTLWNGAVRAYNKRKFRGIEAHPSQYVDYTNVSAL
ncbi:ABC transporter substrate-binding protein [Cryptosporangium aurantiacum]|uniref:Peptide/nickel transport system substrate-binding protein n=1 Tax=Cryptosporangium aurantiacum TaxID=134849 RepID=A0A1M7KAX9_9ACTN|nr:ABC transporter substrate-binding protein [Cryptosporangium aurantiacum]SHM62331.1 peptide/nickel transport system substrate-binding protein [Cryptosporangium aurantiacum]